MSLTHQTNTAQPETVALFVSDVHLHESLPKTTQAFLDFLQQHARHTKQLYLLGDLFEYWAGDDDLSTPFNQAIAAALHAISASGVELFWIAGNRDFLVSEGFAKAASVTLLADPYVATIAGRQLILSHGDALCTDDTGYMAFRAQVRQTQWQQEFLSLPLAKRKAIIAGMRDQSRVAQRDKSMAIMDVNAEAVEALFEASDSRILIHGHTHRPALHRQALPDGERLRYVLPDWDCDEEVARGGWLAITADGMLRRIGLDGVEITSAVQITPPVC